MIPNGVGRQDEFYLLSYYQLPCGAKENACPLCEFPSAGTEGLAGGTALASCWVPWRLAAGRGGLRPVRGATARREKCLGVQSEPGTHRSMKLIRTPFGSVPTCWTDGALSPR